MTRPIALLALCAAPLIACRGKETPPLGVIAFQVSAQPAGRTTPRDSGPFIVSKGNDTILFHRVRVVLSELGIAPALAGECEEEEGEEKPSCVMFAEHPLVIDLPLDRAVTRHSALPAPATTYSLFQAKIHRISAARDSGLFLASPDLDGRSVQADGIWSRGGKRTPFTVASDFAETEEIAITPPIELRAADSLHVTLRVDIASWFVSEDGKTLIDPGTAKPGGPNEHLLRDHIRTSIQAFRDQNGDGQDDGVTP